MAQSAVVLVAPKPEEGAVPALNYSCAVRTARQLAFEGIQPVLLLGPDADRNHVQAQLKAAGIIGLDFYGYGTPTALVGHDSQDVLIASAPGDLSLLSGKGVDILGCNTGSPSGLADSALGAGARFVICYSREVFIIGTAEDMRAMTLAKLSLYHGATARDAYEAQKNAMRERARHWEIPNVAVHKFMLRNLACYEMLGDDKGSWS